MTKTRRHYKKGGGWFDPISNTFSSLKEKSSSAWGSLFGSSSASAPASSAPVAPQVAAPIQPQPQAPPPVSPAQQQMMNVGGTRKRRYKGGVNPYTNNSLATNAAKYDGMDTTTKPQVWVGGKKRKRNKKNKKTTKRKSKKSKRSKKSKKSKRSKKSKKSKRSKK